ncbi:YbfB/YjiJ family MFS transporter [Halomonas shantousis]
MTAPQRPPAGLMIATGILVIVVTLVFARLAYGLILPPMREGLGLSYQQAGNLGTVTALAYLCLVMVAGSVAARKGGKLAILLGVLFATTGFVGLSLASNYLVLLALMALLGFGTAFAYTPLISLLATWFPARRGAVIGLLTSGVGIGMLLAGFLVPYLTERFGSEGWRMTWCVFAATGVLAMVAVLAFLRNPPLPETSQAQPIDRAGVFRNRRVIVVGLAYGVIGMTYIVQTLFMFSYALDAGVSTQTAGRLVSAMGVLSIVAAPTWGWLSDRLGRGSAMLVAMILVLVATAMPVAWPVTSSFVAHYLLLGGATSGLFTSVLAASTEQVAPREAPLAVSYVTVFFAIGQLLGPALAGTLIEWTGGFQVVFAISCLVLMAGIYLSWLIRGFSRPAAASGVMNRS